MDFTGEFMLLQGPDERNGERNFTKISKTARELQAVIDSDSPNRYTDLQSCPVENKHSRNIAIKTVTTP